MSAFSVSSVATRGKSAVVRITGTDETNKAIAAMATKIERKLIGNALRAGARVVQKDARKRADAIALKGLLSDSLKVYSPKRKRPGELIQVIGPDPKFRGPRGERPIKYAHLIEFGTAPHLIRPRRPGSKAALDLPGIGTFAVVSHPGTRARPFLRPAFDANVALIEKRIAESLKRGIDREMAKSKPKAA